MSFVSPNKADNISIATATDFCGKLSRLGFRLSPLHINETVAGAAEASYIPVSDIPAEDLQDKYNVIVHAGGDWHNVAKLILQWGTGTAQDFREVFNDISRGGDANAALLNVPGAVKAIERLIKSA